MHPLYDVTTVIEDAADVFCVNRAGKVGVTVMPSVPAGCADPLEETQEERQVLIDSGSQCFLSDVTQQPCQIISTPSQVPNVLFKKKKSF